MATKGKTISEVALDNKLTELDGSELVPLAKNGSNAVADADTIKKFAQDGLAKASDVPTKVSELENDSKFQTESDVDDKLADKVDKEDGKGLSSNDFTDEDRTKLDGIEHGAQVNPTKVSELTNDLKYQTATQVENRMAILYESLDSQLVDEYTHLDNKKVDKVEGKQLSTEDFTTLLRQKLDDLTNYDDATLTSELNALKSRLDTLVGSGDVTAVIDTFQEIENFLQGVTNTQTLTGLLQEMKSEIESLCDNTYVSKSKTENVGGEKTFTSPVRIKSGADTKLIFNNTDGEQYTRVVFQESDVNYAVLTVSGEGFMFSKPLIGAYKYPSGTASQFLKADGTVDSTAYLPKSGGSITGNIDIQVQSGSLFESYTYPTNPYGIRISAISTGETQVQAKRKDTDEVFPLNLNPNGGVVKANGSKIWHEGNDGSGSGLDADKLDGKHNGELTALNFKKITSAEFDATADLANGGILQNYTGYNSWKNTPAGMTYGSVLMLKAEDYGSLSGQLAWDVNHENQTDLTRNLYWRAQCTGYSGSVEWGKWHQIAFTDGSVDKLNVKRLTNEDLNSIKDGYFTSYNAEPSNTCLNKPDGVAGFGLQVFKISASSACQVMTDFVNNRTLSRIFKGDSWTAWKQLVTDDIPNSITISTGLTLEQTLEGIRANGLSLNLSVWDSIKNFKKGDIVRLASNKEADGTDIVMELTVKYVLTNSITVDGVALYDGTAYPIEGVIFTEQGGCGAALSSQLI